MKYEIAQNFIVPLRLSSLKLTVSQVANTE